MVRKKSWWIQNENSMCLCSLAHSLTHSCSIVSVLSENINIAFPAQLWSLITFYMIQILNNASESATLTWLLSWWWSQRWWCCRWCDRCAFSSIHSAHTHSSLFFVRCPCNNRLSISQQILSNTDANKEIKDLPLHDMGCWCWCSHPYFNSHGARKSIVYGNQFQFDEIIIFYTVENGNLIFSGGVLSSMLSTPRLCCSVSLIQSLCSHPTKAFIYEVNRTFMLPLPHRQWPFLHCDFHLFKLSIQLNSEHALSSTYT